MEIARPVKIIDVAADLAPDHRAATEIDRDHVTVTTVIEIINEIARKTDLPSLYGTVPKTSLKIDHVLKVDLAHRYNNEPASHAVLHATEVLEMGPARPHQPLQQCQKSATRPRTPSKISKRNMCQLAEYHCYKSALPYYYILKRI